ncbi:MAG: thrombospondin type 3 repeat-containing protein [Kiritimatiellae bacterium]|nr:thrombospondin type 3 repeat-containing protein [Kiritimatiellia bacterium]
MKSINELPFLRQYDKLMAVIVLIGLVISLSYLTNAGVARKSLEIDYIKQLERLQPSGKPLQAIAMAEYDSAVSLAKNPPLVTLPPAGGAGFVTPERRVTCVEAGCLKPIPYEATNCPFCGTAQPVPKDKDPELDSDGDGISDRLELELGLNPNDPSDAAADADGDGFTNLEEILAGTDIHDPKSHPPLMNLLRVKSVQSLKIPFIFSGLNTMPDGMQMVFNTVAPRKTYWVKDGEQIGDSGWRAIKAEQKFAERENPNMPGIKQKVEVSTVVVKRESDNKEVTMKINEGRKDTDVEATLVLRPDQSEYAAVEGGSFKVREEIYRVISIDKEASSVVVEYESTGKQKVITKLD